MATVKAVVSLTPGSMETATLCDTGVVNVNTAGATMTFPLSAGNTETTTSAPGVVQRETS